MSYPDYPLLRSSVNPRWARLSPAGLERVVATELWAEAADVEDFLGGLQDFGRGAGQVFQRALPGVVQGASTGAAFGPWGALIGALGGGAVSALNSSGAGGGGARPSPSPRPAPVGMPAPPAFQATPSPALGPVTVPASPAIAASSPPDAAPVAAQPAASLLGLLARPEVMQALTSLAMGQNGRSTVSVGNTQVPVGAIANMVSALAAQSASTAPTPPRTAEDVEDVPAYLRRSDGSLRVLDPSSSQDRAEALLELFESTPSPFAWGEDQEDVESDEAFDEAFDAELYEAVIDTGEWP